MEEAGKEAEMAASGYYEMGSEEGRLVVGDAVWSTEVTVMPFAG